MGTPNRFSMCSVVVLKVSTDGSFESFVIPAQNYVQRKDGVIDEISKQCER